MELILLNIRQALDSIRANLLRASFTIIIIAFGITALVGVLTSIDGIVNGLSTSFASLGSNTFWIRNRSSDISFGGRGAKRKRFPVITFQQASRFKKEFGDMAPVSISTSKGTDFIATAKYGDKSTNPNVQLMGADENYIQTARYQIGEGRNLNTNDVALARNVTILGAEVKNTLFPHSSPIGKKVNINGNFYLVIGVFKEVGSMGGMGGDKICITPYTSLRQNSIQNNRTFNISVFVEDPLQLNYISEEAMGIFRIIRKLRPQDTANFSILQSNSFVDKLMDNLQILTMSATIIAIITLFGASISLLNVMLISVTERTKEIGIRKAIGASRFTIMMQFLIEAIVVCQIGGIFGILLGIPIGNVVSFMFPGSPFVVPWAWVFLGIFACFIVGTCAGIYPAWKAARVDPIESLRYE